MRGEASECVLPVGPDSNRGNYVLLTETITKIIRRLAIAMRLDLAQLKDLRMSALPGRGMPLGQPLAANPVRTAFLRVRWWGQKLPKLLAGVERRIHGPP
jgi:hypothetical protein